MAEDAGQVSDHRALSVHRSQSDRSIPGCHRRLPDGLCNVCQDGQPRSQPADAQPLMLPDGSDDLRSDVTLAVPLRARPG